MKPKFDGLENILEQTGDNVFDRQPFGHVGMVDLF
jgi:hypothetical protein